jgi:hypothetical protein
MKHNNDRGDPPLLGSFCADPLGRFGHAPRPLLTMTTRAEPSTIGPGTHPKDYLRGRVLDQ